MNRENNREQWHKRVERWQDSGLTAREFAVETGLSLHALRWWPGHFLREARGKENKVTTEAPKPNFIEVTEALEQSKPIEKTFGLELIVSDIVIKVPIGFGERTLCRVLSVVGKR